MPSNNPRFNDPGSNEARAEEVRRHLRHERNQTSKLTIAHEDARPCEKARNKRLQAQRKRARDILDKINIEHELFAPDTDISR